MQPVADADHLEDDLLHPVKPLEDPDAQRDFRPQQIGDADNRPMEIELDVGPSLERQVIEELRACEYLIKRQLGQLDLRHNGEVDMQAVDPVEEHRDGDTDPHERAPEELGHE